MTLVSDSRTSVDVARAFFDAYRRQDVEEMVSYCTENADFRYVPIEFWRKQKVLRGNGKVTTVGKTMWTGLIDAFPDLYNTMESVTADDDGNVAVEVVIGGRQAGAWGGITARGNSFAEPHLFVLHVNDEGLIDRFTGYWNNAGICRQLGHLEVD